MMSAPLDHRHPSDERLVDYLLGALPEADAEPLDELSVADDEFAWRLRAIENDLVDAYVRGELAAARVEQFERAYLASPRRREKVDFARALRGMEGRLAARSASADPAAATAAAHASAAAPARRAFRPFREWALAAAALVAVAGGAYLYLENRRLQEEMTGARSAAAGHERTAAGLRVELERERSASEAIRDELARLRASVPAVRLPSLPRFVLLPMRRGVENPPVLAISAGADRVSIRLRLESDDFPRYAAALRHPATGEAVWESARLPAAGTPGERYVEVEVPAAVLEARMWTFELTGHPAAGDPEFVTSYAFRTRKE